MVRAVRTAGPGATVSAKASHVRIAVTAPNRETARTRVAKLARTGLQIGLRRLTAPAGERAAAAQRAEARVAEELAVREDRTGVTDPTPEHQRLESLVGDLQRQRDVAATTGAPLGPIEESLAENQQALFDLRAQIARHDELVQTRDRAREQAREAIATTDAATVAALSATVEVSDHRTTPWRLLVGGVALGLGAIVLMAGELSHRLRPVPARTEPGNEDPAHTPEAPATPSIDAPVESRQAYLSRVAAREREFYLALEPSDSKNPDPAPTPVEASPSQHDDRSD